MEMKTIKINEVEYEIIKDEKARNNLKKNGFITPDGTRILLGKDSIDLTAEVGYQAKVKGFMSIGLIVKINASTYIIHKKYLYKFDKFSKNIILYIEICVCVMLLTKERKSKKTMPSTR